jgi:D-threo-aldose 1-dehydrogenase
VWRATFTAKNGRPSLKLPAKAFGTLNRLRDQGIIKGWGLGAHRIEPIELTLDLTEVRPDGMLLAGRYTLPDHASALQRLMPAAAAKAVDIVVGGPCSSGVLVGGQHFEYQPASAEILAKVQRTQAIADQHAAPIKAAALQFALAHPATAAVIPGASRPERIAEDRAALKAQIPAGFWHALRAQKPVATDAPLPSDKA